MPSNKRGKSFILVMCMRTVCQVRSARGHTFTLVKELCRFDVTNIHSPRGTSMYGITYILSVHASNANTIVCNNRIEKYIVNAGHTYNKDMLHVE